MEKACCFGVRRYQDELVPLPKEMTPLVDPVSIVKGGPLNLTFRNKILTWSGDDAKIIVNDGSPYTPPGYSMPGNYDTNFLYQVKGKVKSIRDPQGLFDAKGNQIANTKAKLATIRGTYHINSGPQFAERRYTMKEVINCFKAGCSQIYRWYEYQAPFPSADADTEVEHLTPAYTVVSRGIFSEEFVVFQGHAEGGSMSDFDNLPIVAKYCRICLTIRDTYAIYIAPGACSATVVAMMSAISALKQKNEGNN